MRATFVVALIPCAILAACNNANSPGTADDVTTYDPNREAPAAAQDNGFGNSITGESATIPATPSDAIRNGDAVPVAPDAMPGTTGADRLNNGRTGTGTGVGAEPGTESSSDRQSDIIDDTGTDGRLEGGTPVPPQP